MASQRYTTRDLELARWPDFVELFSRGNGWDFCACMYFLRGGHAGPHRGRAERAVENMAEHHGLLVEGRAEGVLVYDGERPVGWCQYGRAADLPTGKRNTQLGPSEADWRITCFVTDKDHRRQGVALAALRGVVEAVERRGGGLIEGYPVATLDPDDPATAVKVAQAKAWGRERSQIIREGRWEQQARWDAHMAARPVFKVAVTDVGLVRAWDRPGQQLVNCGTVGMFEAAGFRAVGLQGAPGGGQQVVMQRRVDAA